MERHSQLRAGNIKQVQDPDYCISLSKLQNLVQLSIFTDVLVGMLYVFEHALNPFHCKSKG